MLVARGPLAGEWTVLWLATSKPLLTEDPAYMAGLHDEPEHCIPGYRRLA